MFEIKILNFEATRLFKWYIGTPIWIAIGLKSDIIIKGPLKSKFSSLSHILCIHNTVVRKRCKFSVQLFNIRQIRLNMLFELVEMTSIKFHSMQPVYRIPMISYRLMS